MSTPTRFSPALRALHWLMALLILTMLFVGLVAAWIPARHALAVDPMILLREE